MTVPDLPPSGDVEGPLGAAARLLVSDADILDGIAWSLVTPHE